MTMTHNAVQIAARSSLAERRTLNIADIRITRDDSESPQRLVGHAAVFESVTEIGDPLTWGWRENIARGAFTKTLQEGDARCLVDHDSRLLVSRVSAGDLRLAEDSIGLAVDSDLDTELSYVADLARNLESRRITGMSFGFYVIRDKWEEEEITIEVDGEERTRTIDVRTILEVRLIEVSAVTFPAYTDTDAGLRAIRDARVPDLIPPSDRTSSAPPAGTRTAQTPATPTNAVTLPAVLTMRAEALAARYRLPYETGEKQ